MPIELAEYWHGQESVHRDSHLQESGSWLII